MCQTRPCPICRKILHATTKEIGHLELLGSWTEVFVASSCRCHKQIISDCLPRTLARLGVTTASLTMVFVGHPTKGWCSLDVGVESPSLRVRFPLCHYDLVLPGHGARFPGDGRLVHPHWIESYLPKLWKERCDQGHHSMCGPPSIPTHLASIRPTWLVDVWLGCLVPALPSHSYVCLSYVWGTGQQFTTQRNNIDALQEPGALTSAPFSNLLPKTIKHSMSIVDMLKERYLWVDALCIVQDDSRQKQQEIRGMSAIFANASLTIVAESVTHADSEILGLVNVSSEREFRQQVWSLESSARIVDLPDFEIGSLWAKRGWTYQEQMFSRRRLIFSHYRPVRWECRGAVWREDSQRDYPTSDPTHLSAHQTEFLGVIPNIDNLCRLLNLYTARKFTYPEDSLRAFEGIATALRPSFPHGFISGLPGDFFNTTLLWQPLDNKLILRVAKRPSTETCLPSWSWAAWEGGLNLSTWHAASNYHANQGHWFSETVMHFVEWYYHTTLQTPGTAIPRKFDESEKRFFNSISSKCPKGWSRQRIENSPLTLQWHQKQKWGEKQNWDHNTRWLYKHVDLPNEYFLYPIPLSTKDDVRSENIRFAPWISCDTREGSLIGGESFSPTNAKACTAACISLRDTTGSWAGLLVLNPSPLPQPEEENGPSLSRSQSSLEGQRLRLVEIAKADRYGDSRYYLDYFYELDHPERPRGAPKYEYYYVLWVEWKDGVAYRRGLGRVVKSIWEAQEREKIHLLLG